MHVSLMFLGQKVIQMKYRYHISYCIYMSRENVIKFQRDMHL